MKETQKIELVSFPSAEPTENFEFSCTAENGTFLFHFKWLNDRWNLWITLPDGTVRQAGVGPGLVSWTGYNDYGIYFKTDMPVIDFNSLFFTELYLLTWL